VQRKYLRDCEEHRRFPRSNKADGTFVSKISFENSTAPALDRAAAIPVQCLRSLDEFTNGVCCRGFPNQRRLHDVSRLALHRPALRERRHGSDADLKRKLRLHAAQSLQSY
jgi:hypothetical protein